MPFGRLHSMKSLPARTLRRGAFCAVFTLIAGSSNAFAQSNTTDATDDGFRLNVETPFSQNQNFNNLTSEIELPAESLGSQIFDLDMSKLACLTGDETCISQDKMLDMRYSKSLSFDTILDIELTPRASVSFNDESSSALVGALVRIGDDLKDGEELKSNAWYVFAGADAEAVS